MARLHTVAVLAAAALFAPALAIAQAPERRIGPMEFFFREGAYLERYANALSGPAADEKAEREAIGAPLADSVAAQARAAKDADALAEAFVRGAEGFTSTLMSLMMSAQLYLRQGASPDEAARRSAANTNVMHLPGGGAAHLTMERAYYFHRYSMRLAAGGAQRFAPAPSVAGDYDAKATGECPFADGPLALVQQGMAVEGRRGAAVLLAGAVGGTQAHFIAAEGRYASLTRSEDGKSLNLSVPDRPLELYRGALEPARLVLQGVTERKCTLELLKLTKTPASAAQ